MFDPDKLYFTDDRSTQLALTPYSTLAHWRSPKVVGQHS